MPKTPLTNNAGSYLPVGEFLKRVDWRSVADLCSDTDEPVPQQQLVGNQNLQAALATASGFFESAILKGKRYTPADILAFQNLSAGQAAVFGLLKSLTMTLLWERRPTYPSNPVEMQRAAEWLTALANGEAILSFEEAARSGVLEPQRDTIEDVLARRGIAVICRGMLGRRANLWPDRWSRRNR